MQFVTSQLAQRFLCKWTLATTLGWVFSVLSISLVWSHSSRNSIYITLVLIAFGTTIGGLIMGLGQWLTLKQYVPTSRLWILATAFGWLINATLIYISIVVSISLAFFKFPHSFEISIASILIGGGIGGLLTCFLHYLVVRRNIFRFALWILVTTLSSAICTTLFLCLFLYAVGILPSIVSYFLSSFIRESPAHLVVATSSLLIPILVCLLGIIFRGLFSFFTGSAMIFLLRLHTQQS